MENLNQEPLAEEVQQPAAETTNWKRFFLDILETLVLAVILFVGINAVSARVRVDGFSMRPTLEDGEFERGDIIVFHFPLNPEEELVKRIIGLPGDHIHVQNGQVFLNDQLLDEGYIAQAPLYSGDWVVTEGHLFVMGDNRNNSNDSKDWGLLPEENVVGKAVVIYWPPPMWGVLDHPEVAASQ